MYFNCVVGVLYGCVVGFVSDIEFGVGFIIFFFFYCVFVGERGGFKRLGSWLLVRFFFVVILLFG